MFAIPDGHTYRVELECGSVSDDTGCLASRRCSAVPGGLWYTIFRDNEEYGRVCLDPSTAENLGAITPAMVAREFENLDWPSATLTIEPPGGRTLVNLPAVFSTSLEDPQTQTVTLLGQRVAIEATPTLWTWQPGGGEASWETDNPGEPYRSGDDVSALNTHTYAHAGTYALSVNITYTGRYRIGGQPGWIDIPDTLTVQGPSTPLDVVEASGQLAGR